MVKEYSYSERGNALLPLHGLLFPISRKVQSSWRGQGKIHFGIRDKVESFRFYPIFVLLFKKKIHAKF